MKVRELLDALSKVDPELPVSIDGCDCSAEATAVFFYADREAGEVYLAREDTESMHDAAVGHAESYDRVSRLG